MQINTELAIDAPASDVWKVLTDFASYPQWNPVITKIEGSPIIGEQISFKICVFPKIELPIMACEILIASEQNKELRWRGPTVPVLDAVITGEHYFMVQAMGEGKSRLIHGENFTGLIVPALAPLLQARLTSLYSSMNKSLKERCEKLRLSK